MPPHKINSTSIDHVDFHEPDTLEIKFNTGQVYHYKDCEKDHFHGMKIAKSAGQYFRQNILGKYDHEKQ
jgi:hypothetical protein